MSEVHPLLFKMIEATKDNYLSLQEARVLVSPKTVGPKLDKEESEILRTVYNQLIEGSRPGLASKKIGAEDGVGKILSERIEEGRIERKKAATTLYSTLGGGLAGFGLGLWLALTGPAIPIAMAVVIGFSALVGGGVGNLIGRGLSYFSK